jgi:hypothetical protein
MAAAEPATKPSTSTNSPFSTDRSNKVLLLAELDRIGSSNERKAALRAEFDEAEPGTWIDVRPGYRIQRSIDWTKVDFRESLNDPIVGHEVPLGLAYLYLAVCLGDRIYDEALKPVRAALRKSIDGDPTAARELLPLDRRMGTNIVEPVHLLRAKADSGGVLVTLQYSATSHGLCISRGSRFWASRPSIESTSKRVRNAGLPNSRKRDARVCATVARQSLSRSGGFQSAQTERREAHEPVGSEPDSAWLSRNGFTERRRSRTYPAWGCHA